jgi:hypothetical protein
MMRERSIKDEIASTKKQYKRVLSDLGLTIQGELAAIAQHDFTPSTATETQSFQLIQRSNQLRSLMGVDHD